MRTATVFYSPFLLAALAGCRDLPEASHPWPASDPAPQAALEADHPRVMLASPEITNYAPPDWPLEPGETVTDLQWRGLEVEHGSRWGIAVVWVVGESGAALPFVAGFDYDWTNTYVGHVPKRLDQYGPGVSGYHSVADLESELPASLRGVVDVRDHIPSSAEWRDFRRLVKGTPGGLREVLETERKRYYGEGASW